MKYKSITEGTFLARPNRFIALAEVDGHREVCHVKNTGRCRELLVPGVPVFLASSDNPARKTNYDLVVARKENGRLINLDSQAPNLAAGEFLHTLFPLVRPEVTHGDSRFDFYCEGENTRTFVEVKGVTLEEDGMVQFPDAPTLRGTKHLRGLERCIGEGFSAWVLFVVQMENVSYFTPHDRMDPPFGAALRKAAAAGVRVLAYDCRVTPESMTINQPVEVRL